MAVIHLERIVLTFALSPKGMILATEMDPKLSRQTKRQLICMRAVAIAEWSLKGKHITP